MAWEPPPRCIRSDVPRRSNRSREAPARSAWPERRCERVRCRRARCRAARRIRESRSCRCTRDHRAGSDGRRSRSPRRSGWSPIFRSGSPGHWRSIHESAFGVITSRRPIACRPFGVARSPGPMLHPQFEIEEANSPGGGAWCRARSAEFPDPFDSRSLLAGLASQFSDRCSAPSCLASNSTVVRACRDSSSGSATGVRGRRVCRSGSRGRRSGCGETRPGRLADVRTQVNPSTDSPTAVPLSPFRAVRRALW